MPRTAGVLALCLLLASGCGADAPEKADCAASPCTASPPPPAPPAEPMLVPNSPGVSGTLGGAGFGKITFYGMDLEAGHLYRLNSSLDRSGDPESAYALFADDDWEHLVQWPSPGDWIFEALTTRRFYLALIPGHYATQYTVTLDDSGLDDHGGDAGHATPVPGGQSLAGRFNADYDVDALSFPVEAGHAYAVGCSAGRTLKLVDSRGYDLSSWHGTSEALNWRAMRAAESGRMTALVQGPAGGTFSCPVRDLGPDDAGDTVETARGVTLPFESQLSWQLLKDVDMLSFSALAGHRLRITCTPALAESCNVCLVDPAQDPLGYCGFYPDPQQYTLSRSGVYTVTAWAGGYDDRTLIGSYGLRIEDLGP